MKDQDTAINKPGIQLKLLSDLLADPAVDMESAAGVTAANLTAGLSSRTFLDLLQRPELSFSINRDGKVSGVSTFKADDEGGIIYVDSYHMKDQDTAVNKPGIQLKLLSDLLADPAVDMESAAGVTAANLTEAFPHAPSWISYSALNFPSPSIEMERRAG